MIDSEKLLTDLQKQVSLLEDDLRKRCDQDPEVDAPLKAEYEEAKKHGRTALTYRAWRDGELTQVAVAWVLGCVFVRFLEDNELVETSKLAGPGDRLRRARDEHEMYFRRQPEDNTERGYLKEIFSEVGQLPAMKEFFDPKHNPIWLAAPSGDACRQMWQFWQKTDPETGELVHDFSDQEWNTRFLGDLYQDLSEAARERFALLQTPEFVEEFILDRTLTPAIETFGYREARLIDPTCGSGHFLLGAFARLFEIWQEECPGENPRVLAQKALDGVYGVDLNPYAVAIARFRLLLAALKVCAVRKLKDSPDFHINLAVGDSLLHGPEPGVHMDEATLRLRIASSNGTYQAEDASALASVLSRQYHAVVGNPPYINPPDSALNSAYRDQFSTCYRQYALVAPFMERFFDLAVQDEAGNAGYVGKITGSYFTKREWGKKLVQKFLPNWDITHLIDSDKAHIPGHATPTVIVFGRSRSPVRSTVRVVAGRKKQIPAPSNPAEGVVWNEIVEHTQDSEYDSQWISVFDYERNALKSHPISLGTGAELRLKSFLEDHCSKTLGSLTSVVGYSGQTNEDDAFLAPADSHRRWGGEKGFHRQLVIGESVRDWIISESDHAFFPYGREGLVNISDLPRYHTILWNSRTCLGNRATFSKKTYFEEGRPWWEWHQISLERFNDSQSITFPHVCTHPSFVLDRAGRAFNRSAPFLKLKNWATAPGIIGLLNSSTVCFWLKQACHDKGAGGIGGGIASEQWEHRFDFDGTKLKRLPVPDSLPEGVGSRVVDLSEATPIGKIDPTTSEHKYNEWFSLMVALQEELDWRSYLHFGLIDEGDGLTLKEDQLDELPGIRLGERSFEIRMARKLADSETETTWFERHKDAGSRPITEIPDHWPSCYRTLAERRLAFIEKDKNIQLLECPEYKRRWNTDAWAKLQKEALEQWLLARLEGYFFQGDRVSQLTNGFDPSAQGFIASARPYLVTANQLADTVQSDSEFLEAAEVFEGVSGFSLPSLIRRLVESQSVPFLPLDRYTASGLRKRRDWELTWDLQRKEDKEGNVGSIPVPPRYANGDFAQTSYWKLRGKLDVPKERWISYPGAERAGDDSFLIAWAGWDHLQQAQALAEYFLDAKDNQGWPTRRLKPLLAGICDLLPWLKQWHNDHDPNYGTGLGDYFAGFLEEQCRALDLTVAEVDKGRFEEEEEGGAHG